jgi:beta propeller repeat protein
VWNDWRNGNWDIYGYDLSTSTEIPICTNAAHQYFPRTGGNYAVWWDERNGIGNWDIYGYDFSAGTEFPICLDPNNQGYPAVHGNIVAWIDNRNGNWDIYGYDISTGTEFPICTDTSDQFRPWVWDDIVVWFDMRNGNQDIYGYQISTGTEFQITTNTSDQRHPKVYHDTVVWHDRRTGDYNIYGANLSLNQPLLTVNTAGTGTGTVTSNPPGIDCGNDCTEAYPNCTTLVTLNAVASSGSTFAGWSGDPDCADGEVRMTVPTACIATFEALPVLEEEFVPEPGSVLLLGSGLAGLGAYARLRWRARKRG